MSRIDVKRTFANRGSGRRFWKLSFEIVDVR